MFKGIVEGTGRVRALRTRPDGARLELASSFPLSNCRIGASIAVNGCCLTVVKKNGREFAADLSHETLRVTNLGDLRPGDLVNLERPLRLNDLIDGHLVQGHVDGVGRVVRVEKGPEGSEITIGLPEGLRPYLIAKGSIAVDGISMTVNRLTRKTFTLVVIPHTLQVTNLKAKRSGDPVNLEVDMVGKYIESFATAPWKRTKKNRN